MNHTIVIDEEYRERRYENRLNEVFRHCRIGNVTFKLHGTTDESPAVRLRKASRDFWNGYRRATDEDQRSVNPSGDPQFSVPAELFLKSRQEKHFKSLVDGMFEQDF